MQSSADQLALIAVDFQHLGVVVDKVPRPVVATVVEPGVCLDF